MYNVESDSVKPFKKSETLANIPLNQLHVYPTSYDSTFWKDFSLKKPEHNITSKIRQFMESEKPLETQFKDKHVRDDSLQPPNALKKEEITVLHGDKRIDNYAWLKDTLNPLKNQEVMNYIREENKYINNFFIPLRDVQRNIFQELMARLEINYSSLPIKSNGYLYNYSYNSEQQYPIHYRTLVGSKSKEILLDVNKLAKAHDGYYSAVNLKVSPGNMKLAYFENTTGSDNFVLRIKDLTTQKLLSDSLLKVGDMVWLNDTSIIYTLQEAKTFRSYKVLKHTVGKKQSTDQLLYEEKDYQFAVGLGKSHSKKYIFVHTGSNITSEVYYLSVDGKHESFSLISPRVINHMYSVQHYQGDFCIVTNNNAPNYRVVSAPTDKPQISNWKELVPATEHTLIQDIMMFKHYMVISEKENAQSRIKIINKSSNESHYIKFKEDIYEVSLSSNPEYNSNLLRLRYSSPKTPSITYDYDMASKDFTVLKKQSANLEKWTAESIKTKRVWAEAKDGTKIPITLVYNKYRLGDEKRYGVPKMFLTSYGAYGAGMSSHFTIDPLLLIDKGFVYAIAHVRGGNDLGTEWYNQGKLMNKKNTFTDFITCSEYLIKEEYASKGNIVAYGASAGGLLMGAIANLRPDLFKLVILEVPFVDVTNTMLDKDLPLTTMEYGEWGNPAIKKHYQYINSYAPYENVSAQAYPHMLFLTALNDSRVGYWEPAKMVAKLRNFKTDDNLVLLKTDLNSGHGGGSGRFDYYRNLAYKYAIILELFEKDRQITKYEKK